MAIIGLQGLRGGVGTTSITAALGWSLQQLGERVLVIDASPDNLLRLFSILILSGLKAGHVALLDNKDWRRSAWRYADHLDVLPYGQLTATERENLPAIEETLRHFIHALAELKASNRYSWILIDFPHVFEPLTAQILNQVDQVITVTRPDTNCHIRLHQQALPKGSRILVNYLRVGSQLQDDIYQLWLQSQRALIPIVLHCDEAMAECAATKQPLGEYRRRRWRQKRSLRWQTGA